MVCISSTPLKLDAALRFNVTNFPNRASGKSLGTEATCVVYICEVPDMGLGGHFQNSAEQMGLSSKTLKIGGKISHAFE